MSDIKYADVRVQLTGRAAPISWGRRAEEESTTTAYRPSCVGLPSGSSRPGCCRHSLPPNPVRGWAQIQGIRTVTLRREND